MQLVEVIERGEESFVSVDGSGPWSFEGYFKLGVLETRHGGLELFRHVVGGFAKNLYFSQFTMWNKCLWLRGVLFLCYLRGE